MKLINFNNLSKGLSKFKSQKTFPYAVIDNFFSEKIAKKLEKEFPNYKDKNLHVYNNYCEVKKTLNIWNLFPSLTYNIFTILNSDKFPESSLMPSTSKPIFVNFSIISFMLAFVFK